MGFEGTWNWNGLENTFNTQTGVITKTNTTGIIIIEKTADKFYKVTITGSTFSYTNILFYNNDQITGEIIPNVNCIFYFKNKCNLHEKFIDTTSSTQTYFADFKLYR